MNSTEPVAAHQTLPAFTELQPDRWARTSMGKFFSDRTIAEYASEIWGISPEKVRRHSRQDLQ